MRVLWQLFLLFALPIQVFSAPVMEDIFAFQRILLVAPSPLDQRVAFVTNTPEGSHWIYRLFLAEEGKSKPLVEAESISSVEWSPDGKKITYLKKGNEFQSIFEFDLVTRESSKLFEFRNDIISFKWAPNGGSIAFTSFESDSGEKDKLVDVAHEFVNIHLYLLDIQSKTARVITSANYSISDSSLLSGYDWSPDSESLAFAYQPHAGSAYELENKIAIIQIKNLETFTIPYSESNNSSQPTYSPDGKWIAFQASLSNEEILKRFPHMESKDYSPLLLVKGSISKICLYNTNSTQTHCLGLVK